MKKAIIGVVSALGLILLIVLLFNYTRLFNQKNISEVLDSELLQVEEKNVNTVYKPVDKNIAEESLPFNINYPSYFPFEKEETGVVITGWEHSKEKIVVSIRYPSIEEEMKWKEDTIIQPPIPHVTYTIANFDYYYSKYTKSEKYEKVWINDDLEGLYKVNQEMNGAELHWFSQGKEYNLELLYFSEDSNQLKTELISIANSIN